MTTNTYRRNHRNHRNRRLSALVAVAVAVGAMSANPAAGINIIMNYNPPGGNEPLDDDPTGVQLTAIMGAVEQRYQDIFEDNDHTITINFWWEDLPTLLGQHTLVSQTGGNNSRETEANIRFDTRTGNGGAFRNYFFDPTPGNDTEFNMGQVLFRDLTGTEQGNFFTGTVPSVFEVGYSGNPTAGSPAAGLIDTLSLAFHEVGHALGMSSSNDATVNETGDGFYDFNSIWVGGNSMGASIFTGGSDSLGHLDNDEGLMFGGGLGLTGGGRVLPSATDILSMATGHNYNQIDLPRQDFLTGNTWNLPDNWAGNQVPGSADDAYVRIGANVSLIANGRVENLQVDTGNRVNTGNNLLRVDDTLLLEHNGVALRPFLHVETGGEADADTLILNGGELLMTGGVADVHNDLLVQVSNGNRGRINGRGMIQIEDDIVNDGLIRANGGTLAIHLTGEFSDVDLDGLDEDGELEVTTADLIIDKQQDGGVMESFDGLITIGTNRTATFTDEFALGENGLLHFQGGADGANAATLDGGHTALAGDVEVDGFARIDTDTAIIFDGTTIDIAANGPSGTLEIDSVTTYDGGGTIGSGLFKQDGNVSVSGDFSVANAQYDWDGDGLSTMTIGSGASLSISSSTVEPTANDGRDGIVNVNGGHLSVLPAWRLDGTLNLRETGGGQVPVFDGVGGVTIHTTGEMNVIGDAEINSPVTVNGDLNIGEFGEQAGVAAFNGDLAFASTSAVDIEFGSTLAINGNATYDGGSHVGGGTLRIDGDVVINSATSWGMASLDWDGAQGDGTTTVGLASSLSVASSTVEPTANDGHDGTINLNSGALSVLTSWRLDGELNMTQIGPHTGEVQFVRPSLSGAGGLTIHTTGELNTDGNVDINTDVTVNGDINATDGTVAFNGEVEFNDTALLIMITPVIGGISEQEVIELNGQTTYSGGGYIGNGTIRQNGNATINAPTTISVGRFDMDGDDGSANPTIQVNADLTLDVQQIDVPSFIIFGSNKFDSSLEIANGATLTVNTDSPWTMNGNLTLGAGGGQAATVAGSTVNIGNTLFSAFVTVDGLGELAADTNFRTDAVVSIPDAGDRLDVTGVASLHGGSYTGNGTLAFHNDVNVVQDTTIDVLKLDLDGDADGDQRMVIAADRRLVINANTIDTSADLQYGDAIELRDGSRLEVNTIGAWLLGQTGEISLQGVAGSSNTVVAGQNITSSGLIQGNGHFELTLSNNGTVAPGLSAGRLSIEGTYGHTLNGVLEIELGGLQPGVSYDQITVTEDARLAGTLDVDLIDGFLPTHGDLFEIMIASEGITGQFDEYTGDVFTIGADLVLVPVRLERIVDGKQLLALVTTGPADANVDGQVSFADFQILQNFFNEDETDWFDGNFNYPIDDEVTIADFQILQNHFQNVYFDPAVVFAGFNVLPLEGSLALSASVVPEPGTGLIAGTGMLIACVRTRRRQYRPVVAVE